MPQIKLLNEETIDKIAAGEVVERPSSVVKELVENAIDAKATAVTVEIKEGGISYIRITDNGCGIERNQVPLAFLRHSTSKIKSVEDLLSVTSLGFRGEALSSIAAVSQVEIITKTCSELTGTRYVIEGSNEKDNEEIGAPDGTTFIVRNLFYNTPARRKFLKTAQTEGNYISDLMERLALSHPEVSFKFISNGQTKMHTSGNSNEKDMIYHIYGRDITSGILPVQTKNEYFSVHGFIGKPIISRGNRNFESFFINGRYIKSTLLSKALEEAYKGFLMQRQYPFCVLYLTMDTDLLDINVHPTKMELRFSRNEEIYQGLYQIVRSILSHKELIPEVPIEDKKHMNHRKPAAPIPEPFEKQRIQDLQKAVAKDSPYEIKYPQEERFSPESEHKNTGESVSVFQKLLAEQKVQPVKEEFLPKPQQKIQPLPHTEETYSLPKPQQKTQTISDTQPAEAVTYEQQTFLSEENRFLSDTAAKKHKIIGQLFDTYWLIEYEDKLFVIDQHAAHEKVLYEKIMARIKMNTFASQSISPPIVLTLSLEDQEMLKRYANQIKSLGYEIEPFGGKEYSITAVPADFEIIDPKNMFIEMLDGFSDLTGSKTPELILEKAASMSCKAAVKGKNHLSRAEAEALIDELLKLENPYHCPHGRPTIISMSKYEIERKFKRIV